MQKYYLRKIGFYVGPPISAVLLFITVTLVVFPGDGEHVLLPAAANGACSCGLP